MIKIAPSILAADMLNMQRDVTRMVEAGCDMIHVDIMDAHFVPNMSYGPDMVKALKKAFTTPLDVHLMMDNPEKYLETFIGNGADILTIHAEIPGDVRAALEKIHELGAKTGLSVKPGTPVETIAGLLPLCDMVLVMTVEPGFGGQKFMADMMPKVEALAAMRKEKGLSYHIQVDGGITLENVDVAAKAGANVFVAGSAVFSKEKTEANARSFTDRFQTY